MDEIRGYTLEELVDIIENQKNLYEQDEMNEIKKRYNTLLAEISKTSYKQYDEKDILRELAPHNLCLKRTLTPDQIANRKRRPDEIIEKNMYLCTLDEYTNTRILLGIFKCVNTIKNILITGIVLGIIGVVLSMFVGK